MDCSPPGSSAHGIFQARIPEWIAISYSRGFTSLPVSKWAFIKYVRDNGLPWWPSGKEFACNAGDAGSISGLGRSPGEGNGNPLQYSCLEDSTDRGAWRATVHGVTENQTRPSKKHFDFQVLCCLPSVYTISYPVESRDLWSRVISPDTWCVHQEAGTWALDFWSLAWGSSYNFAASRLWTLVCCL